MAALAPAFADPVLSAQSTFRAMMDATARPGSVHKVSGVAGAPKPLSPAAAALALTLFDHDTPLWLDFALAATPRVVAWLRFHTGAPIVAEPGRAAFALVYDAERLLPFEAFDSGSAEYPDRSTTLILHVKRWDAGPALLLTGPGIPHERRFHVAPLPTDISARLVANRALFPRGLDLLLASDGEVAALPRSVRVTEDA